MKYLARFFSVLLVVGMIVSFIPQSSTQAKDIIASPVLANNDKIEPALVDKLSADGKADFIVEFKDQADLSAAYQMNWDERGWYVYNALTDMATKSQAVSKAIIDKLGFKYQTFITGNELYVWSGDLLAAQSLAQLPEVVLVRSTRTFSIDPLESAASPIFTSTWAGDLLANHASFDLSPDAAIDWGILDTKADQFWESYGFKGEGILVSSIDTGVMWNHPALVNQFKCAGNPSDPACWADPSNVCGGSACDNVGHGTHTMGSMVAKDDPGLQYIAGMAPNAQWIACKGCESNSCSEAALNGCADWILAPGGNPANRPNIVNNSWGGGGGDAWYLPKVQAWRASGIFPAFSAGNSYTCSSMGSPGDYQESFASAAHDVNRLIADFSSKGPSAYGHTPYTKPNISAPGVDVCSSVPGGGFECAGWSGTSMASPHSAGAVALLWSCNPSLIGQIDQTFQILQSSADTPPAGTCSAPPDGEGNYTYGYGYLNTLAAGLTNCGDVGYLDGFVTSNSQPIAGADVTAAPILNNGMGVQAITDPDGYYHMTLQVGTYDVTASHPQYITQVVSGVEITVEMTTTQDIVLQPKGHLFGYVTDDPNGFPLVGATVAADNGSTTTTNNAGYYEMYLDPGTYTITATLTDYAPHSLPVELFSGVDTQLDFGLLAAVSVVPDPIHAYVQLGSTTSVDVSATNNLAQDYPFEFLEIQMGQTLDSGTINASGGPDPFGYTYIDSNEPGGSLYEWIDATDGTALGLLDDGEAAVTLPFTFNFYGTNSSQITVGNNGGVIFNTGTGDLPYTNSDLSTSSTNNLIAPFWDDMDDDSGNVYYKVVGEAPFRKLVVEWYNRPHFLNIGNATFEVILYESTNDIKFQYQDVVFGNVLYDNGASATVGIRQAGTNFLQYSYNQPVLVDNMSICFNYPGSQPCDGGDVHWFGESIPGGSIPGSVGTLDWTTAFTATQDVGIYQPGDYNAVLRLQPTAIGLPAKLVPVIMTVQPTATLGLLQGNVTSDRPGGPLVAEILIEASGGMSVTISTDPAGFYSFYLETGAYTVTASAPGYLADSADVMITGNTTTTQNFVLLLDQPGIVLDPSVLVQSLTLGNTATQTLDISNDGQQPLVFDIAERNGEFIPSVTVEDVLVVAHDTTAASAMESALTTAGYTYLGVTDAQFQAMTVDQLLQYLAVFHAGTTGSTGAPTASETLLMAYLDAGGSLFISDNDLGYYRQGSVFYATYLQSTYNVDDGGSIIDGLNLMAGLTVNISADPYPDGITAGPEGIPIFQFQGGPYKNGVAVERGSYRAVYTGFDYQYVADSAQKVEIIKRVLDFIATSDAPWLTEEPITGTIPAGQTTPVEVTFNASVVAQPGTYTAKLKVRSNDPLVPVVDVPVTMIVEPAANMGLLEGTISSRGYCDAQNLPLEAAVLIENDTGTTWDLVTDANGYYFQWLPADTYSVTASAPLHLEASGAATVVGQQTTTLNLGLRSIQPCMDVEPTAITVTLPVNRLFTDTLSIINTGAGPLTWELHETTATIKTEAPTQLSLGGSPLDKHAPENAGSTPVNRSFNLPTDILLSEGFEAGLVPPTDWSRIQTNPRQTWKLQTIGTPYQGIHSADVEYDDQLQAQNEVLLTPEMRLNSATLSFWSFGSLYWCRDTYDNCDLNIWIVVGAWDGGTGNDIFVGKADNSWTANFVWANSTFNLTPLLPSGPVRIAFQYTGLDGAQVALDAIQLDGELGSPWVDVPWVSEVPTSGITLPGGVYDVKVVFDTSGLNANSCYDANLAIVHDDANQSNPYFVRLHLCVIPEVQNFYLPLVLKH